jgi:DNA-directed RNA polymerase specialized sigma24 family protein
LSPEEVDQVLDFYASGTEVRELAEQFDVHRTTISTLLIKRGVSRYRRVEEHLGEARALRGEGWSYARIAEHFGVQPATVWRALKR